MTDRLTITLAQLNPVVGAINGNIDKVREARRQAASVGADLVVCSELVVSGYPPEDLVLKPFFLEKVEDAVRAFAEETADGGPAVLLTAPWRDGGATYNAALLLEGGKIAATRFKRDLPNYGVFDEMRVFAPGPMPGPIDFKGVRIGVPICEDIWTPDVPECLQESGAEILLVPNGSPYDIAKTDQRLQHAVARVTETGLPLVYVNQVGGQDELVFDGASFVINADHSLAVQAVDWTEAVVTTQWRRGDDDVWVCEMGALERPSEDLESIYKAMTLGLRDYVEKNGFPGVLIGLSGGVDSAITASVAVDALGPNRVRCVMMPSPYTSQESLEDAEEAAQLMGVQLDDVGIQPAMTAFDVMLKPIFGDAAADVTEENIQARLDVFFRHIRRRIAKNRLQHDIKRRHRRLNADIVQLHAHQLRGLLRVLQAFLAGIGRRHHHATHPVRPQRIDRHRCGDRRIDTSRKPNQYTRKSIFLHIIPQSQSHGFIDRFEIFRWSLQRTHLAHPDIVITPAPLCGDDRFRPVDCLNRQRMIRVDHEGCPIEDKLILTADLVHIYKRQAGLRHPCHGVLQALIRLRYVVGRAIWHQQDFRPRFLQALGNVRCPDVLTDWHPYPHTFKVDRSRHRPRREHAHLIEDAVIRQVALKPGRGDFAAFQQQRRIIGRTAVAPWCGQ